MLIDDSPDTLRRALEHGIVAATILHPWNRELCEEEDEVVCAEDWAAARGASSSPCSRPMSANAPTSSNPERPATNRSRKA